MKRVKFKKGEQRNFLKKVLENVNCPSLRAFMQFGFDVPYSTLKNYYSEVRFLPESFFRELVEFGKIDLKAFEFELIEGNWGQIKGGIKSKR
jgi:hypothetical protein